MRARRIVPLVVVLGLGLVLARESQAGKHSMSKRRAAQVEQMLGFLRDGR